MDAGTMRLRQAPGTVVSTWPFCPLGTRRGIIGHLVFEETASNTENSKDPSNVVLLNYPGFCTS